MKKNKNASRNLVIYTLVLVALFVLLFLLSNMSEKTGDGSSTDTPVPIENQPVLGDANAPVTIVEFGDYKCPSCKAWGEQLFPRLKEEYIDTGKVKFSYRNVLFHGEESSLAALAAESVFAQDQEAFWIFHKELFNRQPEQQSHDDMWVTSDIMLDIAMEFTSIDADLLESDIQNSTYLEEVSMDSKLGETYNVQQTPTIFINGTMLDNPFDYEALTSIIEKELGE